MYRQHAENILTHPSLPPLIKGNSRLRQSSPSPDDWLWSPRHVLRWTQLYLAGSSQPHAFIQHPYATRDVTFHVPLASLGSWGSVCQCLHAFSDVDGGPTEGWAHVLFVSFVWPDPMDSTFALMHIPCALQQGGAPLTLSQAGSAVA